MRGAERGTGSIRSIAKRLRQFREPSSHFVSTGAFFGISVVLVLLWFPTILLFPSVDTWQLVLNTAVSLLAFVLVALLQNSERRSDLAALRPAPSGYEWAPSRDRGH
jgi:low affinity Fe/Cu permease